MCRSWKLLQLKNERHTQCCGSASFWCRSGSEFRFWCRSGSGFGLKLQRCGSTCGFYTNTLENKAKKIHTFTAMPVYNVFLSRKWQRCHVVKYTLDSTIKFSGKKALTKKTCAWNYQQSGSAGSAEMTRIRPNPDPVPETEISSNHFFQLVRKPEGRGSQKYLTFCWALYLLLILWVPAFKWLGFACSKSWLLKARTVWHNVSSFRFTMYEQFL